MLRKGGAISAAVAIECGDTGGDGIDRRFIHGPYTLCVLTILCCSLLVVIVSICLGYAAISKTAISDTRAPAPGRLTDTIFAAYWTGLSILLIGATAAVCFGPVGSVGIPALIALLLVALAVKSVRGLIATALRNLRRIHTFLFLGLLSFTGLLSTLVLPWHDCHDGRGCMHDTGLYHAQIIRWYSAFGAVPGMALLHHRLGYHSSVFALAAIFDVGKLVGRSGSVVSLATILVSLVFAGLNLLQRRFSPRNLFWLAFVLVVLGTFDINIAADYPDTTLVFLSGALVWMAWTWRDWGVGAAGGWALILLGAGAMSTKLSGAPLLGAAFLDALYFARQSSRNILRYGLRYSALIVILIAPILAVQTITSGHPLYPALSLALPVSWAAPDNLVLAVRDSIKRFPLYGYDPPVPMTFAQKAVRILFGRKTPEMPYIAGVLAVFLASVVIEWRTRKQNFPVAFAAGLGAIGLIALIQVPQLRFTIGCFAVLPAVVLAHRPGKLVPGVCSATLAMMCAGGPGANRLDIARCVLYLAAIPVLTMTPVLISPLRTRMLTGCLVVVQLMRPVATIAEDVPALIRHPAWLILPEGPLVPRQDAFIEGGLGEVTYKQPVDGYHCWAETLPCAPPSYQADWLTLNALWYRCNAEKLACGFTAVPPAAAKARAALSATHDPLR